MKYLISLIYAALTFFSVVYFILSNKIFNFPLCWEVWTSLQAVHTPLPVNLSSVVTREYVTPCGQMIMCHLCNFYANLTRIFLTCSHIVCLCCLFFAHSLCLCSQKILGFAGEELTCTTHPVRLCGKTRLLTQVLSWKGCICLLCPEPLPLPSPGSCTFVLK